jgi:hypothetical protein
VSCGRADGKRVTATNPPELPQIGEPTNEMRVYAICE